MDSPQLDDGPVAADADPPTRPIASATLDQTPPGGRSGPWPRRLAVGATAAVLIAAVAVAVVVTLGSSSPSRANADTGVPAGETTTTVSRRTLTESATLAGTLGYKGTYELYDRLAEAGTFTWLPSAGSVIGRGGTLFRVNNLPVVLMYGTVPAYRTLKQGVSDGPDVTELNRNLKALGFDPYDEISELKLNHFSAATTAAVKRWQQAEGLKQTGKVELGRVIFAPVAQRVTKVDVSLGQDPPGSSSPGSKSPTDDDKDASEPGSRSPSKSKRPDSDDTTEPEDTGGAGMLVLSTTSTRQLVQLDVKADEQQLAHVGEPAPVTLPSGRVVRGRITEVGTVASESTGDEGKGGESEDATIPVTVALDHPVARLDKAPVSVELVKSVSREVLAVPATALTATAGGDYAIEALEEDRRVELAVTPGMFANGYVQVQGPGVREGLTVIESE